MTHVAAAQETEPLPTWWERAATIFILFMLSGALIGPLFAPDPPDETPALRLFWLPVYGMTAALLLWRIRRLPRAWPALLAIGAMILIAFASKWWSIDPVVTQRRAIAMALSSGFAVYLAIGFPGRRLPGVLMDASLLMAVASLIAVFAYPTMGLHHGVNDGMWRGVWYEKNQMGLVMVSGAIAAAAVLASWPERRRRAWVTLALCTLLVVATQSKTSLLCLAAGLGIVGGVWLMTKGGAAVGVAAVWAAVVSSGLLLIILTREPAAILTALGKDPSLTGRTDIWAAVMAYVSERPWTGYGYSAFWEVDSAPADFIRLQTGWPVPSAHNGWLDLLVQIGWPATLFVGLIVAAVTISAVIGLFGRGRREGAYGLAILAVFIILSLSESVVMRHQSLPWSLFLVVMTRAWLVGREPVAKETINRRRVRETLRRPVAA